jgi:phosphoglycerol transferase MdoB-like AlkP superfamily enzyme
MNSYLIHVRLLLKKLGIAFLIFSICRTLFYLFNSYHFNDVSFSLFFYGLRFDLVSISFLFSPLIILHLVPISFRNIKRYNNLLTLTFYIANTIAIILNLIDVAYFDFTLKRTTSDFFSMINTGDDFFKLLPHYILDFWYNIILLAGLLLLSWFLYKKFCSPVLSYFSYKKKDYLIHTVIFVLFSVLTVFSMRGGFQYKPIDIVNAGQYTKAQNIPIVLNTPFTIIKTILVDNIEIKEYFSDEKIENIYTPKKEIIKGGSLKGKNVVLIILESFAKEYVGGFNNGKGYTPFIDSILNESFAFTNAYANGRKSIEALPCILTGIPQLMNSPYALSNYAGNKLNGLPEILKEEGYNTSFYHGGANGTMGFNGFVGAAGIENYFGLNEYPNQKDDYDGLWGIFDEPYLQYYAKELDKKREPFFSTVFTVSSHHPYTIPEKHKGEFPRGDLPLHETVGYTDYALNRFFKTAERMPWFHNTVFIITADHSAQSNNDYYKTKLGQFAIPFFIYAPSTYLKGKSDKYFQHIDFTPTIMSLLGINKSIISFGNDAFGNENNFSIQFVNGSYQIAKDDKFLIFDGSKTIEFYNVKTDSLLINNLVYDLNPIEKSKLNKLEMLLKGIIQQYNNRLINNQLTISN